MRADTIDDQPCRSFFLQPRSTFHRRYEALRAFFIEGRPPAEVAAQFGYKPAALKVPKDEPSTLQLWDLTKAQVLRRFQSPLEGKSSIKRGNPRAGK